MSNYGLNLYEEEIKSHIDFLNEQIQKCSFSHDWTLLFSDSRIMDVWLALVSAMEKMENWEDEKDKMDLEDDERTYVLYLLALNKLCDRYNNLYYKYHALLYHLSNHSADLQASVFFSSDAIKTLISTPFLQLEGKTGDAKEYLAELNISHNQSLSDLHSTVGEISNVLEAVMNRGYEISSKRCPSRDDLVKAIDIELRQYTLMVSEEWLDDMKRDLDRHYKKNLSEPYTTQLWYEMLNSFDEALKMAMEKRFTDCYEEKQELWDEDVRAKMDKNSELVRRIWWLCHRDKFIDWKAIGDQGDVVNLLKADNLDMFYEIIIRHSIIQCQISPELKKQHDVWLNGNKEQKSVFYLHPQGKYKLAPNNDRHLAKIIQAMFDEGLFLKEDDTSATSVEDVAHYLGPVLGVSFKDWRQTLNAAINSKNCFEIFDNLRRNIEKRKNKKQNKE